MNVVEEVLPTAIGARHVLVIEDIAFGGDGVGHVGAFVGVGDTAR